jgi:hypothetical protein
MSESLHALITGPTSSASSSSASAAGPNSYAQMLRQFSEQFERRALEFFALLLQHSSFDAHADSLFARLDFNGYYAARMREQAKIAAAMTSATTATTATVAGSK